MARALGLATGRGWMGADGMHAGGTKGGVATASISTSTRLDFAVDQSRRGPLMIVIARSRLPHDVTMIWFEDLGLGFGLV